jgi:hypothetical protein
MISTRNGSRPSATVIAGAIILALAIVTTAVAGSSGLNAKLTKASVKKIAKRQINKAAPGLSVAAADSAYARALINSDPLSVTLNRNISQVQVDRPSTGYYCFDVDFVPTNVQVTQETDGLNDLVFLDAVIDPLSRVPPRASGARRGGTFNRCEPGTDVMVTARTTTGTIDVGFFIEISR